MKNRLFSLVNSNDELEIYINKNKEVCFIKVIEESVSAG